MGRPIIRQDFERAVLLLNSLRVFCMQQDQTHLWEMLREIHEQHLISPPEDDPVPERFLSREFSHALILIESIAWGDGLMPAREIAASITACSILGCPEPTYGTYCLHHELER